MELYTDKLFVGRLGGIEKNENYLKNLVPTNEYIIFEKNNMLAIDVLSNKNYYLKDNVFIGIDDENLCIVEYKPLTLFLPDKSLEVVNDYDLFEIIDRLNNYDDIYEFAEKLDFSNISVFKNIQLKI